MGSNDRLRQRAVEIKTPYFAITAAVQPATASVAWECVLLTVNTER